MPNPILHVRCWKCRQSFHMRIWKDDCNPSGNKVSKLIPCPYCETDCIVKLAQEQVGSETVLRGPVEQEPQKPLLHEMPVDAFAEQVFETEQPK